MMPLTYASLEKENKIVRVRGNVELKRHLENLGFVQGAYVKIVNHVNDNFIVSIKDTRVAISKEIANKIMIQEG
ncbi:MAG: ferrous iron transport protein A [Erysipelotrichia bacterium]|nr:ferrous iron transport protein A [Erysipelotrichia bacterium]NCC54078.1 ferrous iron transport protein A [Erysipelotrichia bacterium]